MTIQVLIVSNDPLFCHVAGACLTFSGMSFAATDCALEAAAIGKRARYVILDFDMAYAGGLELIRRLKRETGVPIVALAEASTAADRILAFEAGADELMSKAYLPAELCLRLHSIGSGATARPRLAAV
jgi:DNA-binding response OmpR family regulator